MTQRVEWAYGVTTVPERRHTLLPKTLASLSKAGFDCPRLFVDGPSPGQYLDLGLDVTVRTPQLHPYGNWLLGIIELLMRNRTATRFAMFQDDLVCVKNLREYLTRCHYPNHCYWNLYTFPENQKLCGNRQGWHLSNQRGLGAVALVFNRDALTTLLGCSHLVNRMDEKNRWWKVIDGAVIQSLRKVKPFKEYVHNPSLVQHTGQSASTIQQDRAHPLAESFPGEDFDALSLLK